MLFMAQVSAMNIVKHIENRGSLIAMAIVSCTGILMVTEILFQL